MSTDLAKYAPTLLWLFAPKRFLKMKDLEIDAEINRINRLWEIAQAKEENDIPLSLPERAALQRRYEDELSQRNLEITTLRSIPHLEKEPEGISLEWIRKWTENAKKADFEEAQKIWAEIFAKEVNEGGSVSLKTMRVLSDCTSVDLANLRKTLGYCVTMLGQSFLFVFFADYDIREMEELVRLGILVSLESNIRLTDPKKCVVFIETVDVDGVELKYRVTISISGHNEHEQSEHLAIKSTRYCLTEVGLELSAMFGMRPLDEDYMERTIVAMFDHYADMRSNGVSDFVLEGPPNSPSSWRQIKIDRIDVGDVVSIAEYISTPSQTLKRGELNDLTERLVRSRFPNT